MNDTSTATKCGNQAFILAVAGRAGTPMWVNSFKEKPDAEPPERTPNWTGHAVAAGAPLPLPEGHNNYFATCELKPSTTRKKNNFVRLLVLVADDADPSNLKAPPSYIIETSPGKVQVGYILKDDAETRDRERCGRAQRAMVAAGLVKADKSGNNVVRYARLPVGVNTKYRDHPAHDLREWRPGLTYTLTDALAAMGAAVGPSVPLQAGQQEEGVAWVDNAPGRLDVERAEAAIISGDSLHDPLIRLASHYAAKGLAASEILTRLTELMNQSSAKGTDRWNTRMSKLKGDTIPSAVKKYGSSYASKVDFTDIGNVNLLAQITDGNLRYVTGARLWIYWTGARWERDVDGKHFYTAAGLIGRHYAAEGAKLTAQLSGMDPAAAHRHQKTIDVVARWEKACRGRRGIESMEALARRHPAFTIRIDELDRDPCLLGVQNGVVDLRTGELRVDAREDLITRRSPYKFNAGAKAPRWRSFIAEVTGAPIAADHHAETGRVLEATVGRYRARPSYADYLHRAVGYSCTGLTIEHKMFAGFNDHGSNGKNVVFDTIQRTLGAYATTAPTKLLLAGRGGSDANAATPALNGLDGVRFALCSEPPRGSTFDNSMLKQLTGEAELTVRGLYVEARQMRVQFHIWMLCNEKPQVDHLEQAVAGRILMLPFDRQWNRPGTAEPDPALPAGDKHLAATLSREGEGILAWLVEGAVAYFARGLEPCAEVVDATRAYFKSQRSDPVGKWLAEATEICAPKNGTQASNLFAAFQTWRIARESAGTLRAGDSPVTQTAFGLELVRHKVERAKHGVVKYGARLVTEFDGETESAARHTFAEMMRIFGDLA